MAKIRALPVLKRSAKVFFRILPVIIFVVFAVIFIERRTENEIISKEKNSLLSDDNMLDAIIWNIVTAESRLNAELPVKDNSTKESNPADTFCKNAIDAVRHEDIDAKLDDAKEASNIAIPFLKTFKNPCWIESTSLELAYKGNYYLYAHPQVLQPRFAEAFEYMRNVLAKRSSEEASCFGRTWRLRCLPYFYIAGVSRCGSTDISDKINKHPHVMSTLVKEMNYWNRIRLPSGGRVVPQVAPDAVSGFEKYSINHYLEAFDKLATRIHDKSMRGDDGSEFHHMVFGDATPSYIWQFNNWDKHPANEGKKEPIWIAADFIKAVTPKAKIIIILRNPVDRLYSDYKSFLVTRRKTPHMFDHLARVAIGNFNSCLRRNTLRACVYNSSLDEGIKPLRLRAGIYHGFLKDWLQRCPKQIYITRLEDYSENKMKILNEIFSFLDLETIPSRNFHLFDTAVKNTGDGHLSYLLSPMLNATRSLLQQFYSPYNRELANLLGNENFNWK